MKKIVILFFLSFLIEIQTNFASHDIFIDHPNVTQYNPVEVILCTPDEIDKVYDLLQSIFDAIKDNNLDLLKKQYDSATFLFRVTTWTESNLLHLASIFNRLEIANFLLKKARLCPNSFDRFNETPLSYAIRFNHYEMAKLLIKYNADINLQDKKGRTPLHLAILYKRPQITLLLAHHGANGEIPDKKGIIPFNYYAYYDLQKNKGR